MIWFYYFDYLAEKGLIISRILKSYQTRRVSKLNSQINISKSFIKVGLFIFALRCKYRYTSVCNKHAVVHKNIYSFAIFDFKFLKECVYI